MDATWTKVPSRQSDAADCTFFLSLINDCVVWLTRGSFGIVSSTSDTTTKRDEVCMSIILRVSNEQTSVVSGKPLSRHPTLMEDFDNTVHENEGITRSNLYHISPEFWLKRVVKQTKIFEKPASGDLRLRKSDRIEVSACHFERNVVYAISSRFLTCIPSKFLT